ncbi:hypothetical protein [Neorickettsia findlayensis]|uniref:Uncharacterized protein n=1 Tax=Neorickettsia findlayensis TaxID=2686014 RepID=A0A6P1G9M6_9RICK|nr:hypothetical protein [Neorickettsia findlayensis]QHD64990.1 hypothetical protein GP480_00730 [Neorickettsia findlayensis]
MTQGIFFFQVDDTGVVDIFDVTSCECAMPVIEGLHMSDLLMGVAGPTLTSISTQTVDATPPTDLTQTVGPDESSGTVEGYENITCFLTTEQDGGVRVQVDTQGSSADQVVEKVYVRCLQTSA